MKKIILILSISAVVIMGLSAMALWGCCVYRETLAPPDHRGKHRGGDAGK